MGQPWDEESTVRTAPDGTQLLRRFIRDKRRQCSLVAYFVWFPRADGSGGGTMGRAWDGYCNLDMPQADIDRVEERVRRRALRAWDAHFGTTSQSAGA